MKIIFLNVWHGTVWNELKKFILRESKATDIFGFVEVDPKLHTKLAKLLPGFKNIYHQGIKTEYMDGVREGRCLFVKKGILVNEHLSVKLFKVYGHDAGGMSYVELTISGKQLFLGCVHGKARPGTKLDTPIRIKQSETIIDLFKNKNGPIIIGGDFNLNPDTESVRMFEKAGYADLVKVFGIKNTRNELSWRQFGQKTEQTRQHFADYCFTSSDVKVTKFEVPYMEVSDHLPLILNFDML